MRDSEKIRMLGETRDEITNSMSRKTINDDSTLAQRQSVESALRRRPLRLFLSCGILSRQIWSQARSASFSTR